MPPSNHKIPTILPLLKNVGTMFKTYGMMSLHQLCQCKQDHSPTNSWLPPCLCSGCQQYNTQSTQNYKWKSNARHRWMGMSTAWLPCNPRCQTLLWASDMICKNHSNTSYLNGDNAWCGFAGHFFLGNWQCNNEPAKLNSTTFVNVLFWSIWP